jgi:pimeloyl-ACP methyl ester carboxylesterase
MWSWKKWILIGVSGGATVALAAALTRGLVVSPVASSVVLPAEKPPDWNTGTVSVDQGTATITYEALPGRPAGTPRFSGYVFEFVVQNNTTRDITIPANAGIMRRLVAGGSLVDSSGFAKLRAAALVRANQRATLAVDVEWICLRTDGHGDAHEADPATCYGDLWGGTDAWELFDAANHLQVSLPKPPLTP